MNAGPALKGGHMMANEREGAIITLTSSLFLPLITYLPSPLASKSWRWMREEIGMIR